MNYSYGYFSTLTVVFNGQSSWSEKILIVVQSGMATLVLSLFVTVNIIVA
jgi:hypothetical protein